MCGKGFVKGGISLGDIYLLISVTGNRLDFGKISGVGIWSLGECFPGYMISQSTRKKGLVRSCRLLVKM